jgi:hypothetical protein
MKTDGIMDEKTWMFGKRNGNVGDLKSSFLTAKK